MSVEKTQEIFAALIQKPQLTDQLLSRPPFKFIVDIVNSVIKATGYLKDEFSEEDLSSAGSDKNSKTAFLEKLINILDDGSLKNVKAAKIISGKDAEETNKMLQKLGTNAASFQPKILKKKSSKKSKDDEKQLSKERKSKKEVHDEKLEKSKTSSKADDKPVEERKKKKPNSISKEQMGEEVTSSPIKLEDTPLIIRPTTAAAGGRPMTSMGRPGTAASRPAPPKLKKKQIANVDAIPQEVIELKSKIINEDEKNDINEHAENFIMENDEEEEHPVIDIEAVDEEDRGALVQKIIDKKAEIEDGATQDHEGNLDADRTMSVEKAKVRALQDKLQDLTRSAYPFARLFDFANDDIESMIKELERWRSEQRLNEQEDQNKRAAGYGDSSRLYNIIANLQKEINDIKEELSKARGRVLKNEKRIQLFIANF
ncbi:unnamed protein product [Caenorhabditis sp. 36 PRJEB53466]|nr:unnamed protein product [Caenorhabditis sp. 36 PRJEB53466]